MKQANPELKFVVIGGGTGSFTVLRGLREYTSNITALVSMADDGGSTGVLRDELGVLPPGDVRQCLVALSDSSQELRDLFNFRFEEGSLGGHSFGNLFLSAIEKMTNDFNEAVRMAGDLLQIKGRVLPITLDNIRLAMQWDDEVVRGEGTIDVMDFSSKQGTQPKLFLEPSATVNPSAVEAIKTADVIVIAPGDIYTSLGPLLVVDGVAEALANAPAKKIYISNLVVNPRQTKGFTVADHVAELERFANRPFIDYVLYNTDTPDPEIFARYAKAGEELVAMDKAQVKAKHYTIIGRKLLSKDRVKAKSGDKLAQHRSLIRHDGAVLARALIDIAHS